MHPRAWADADPQLQGWDLDGRCPGLGPPPSQPSLETSTCTCNQQLLLPPLKPAPALAPATGAARGRFVMLFLIPTSK